MSSNPFSSRDRQHFPEFSPMFNKKTPSSVERNTSFRWSIDQIARLKPADIDTDPATLIKTNRPSPFVDAKVQEDIDKFFSQKTILPSPWTSSATAKTAAHPAKRVTFSPLPPATAFIRNDSLVESELRDSRTTDAGTQTTLTFPVECDVERLLGILSTQTEEESNRDLTNSSLRRKLFGKPERQCSPDGSSEGEDIQMSDLQAPGADSPVVHVGNCQHVPAFTPISKSSRFPSSSSTPLHPSHYLQSPAIVFAKSSSSPRSDPHNKHRVTSDNPAHSSMVLHTPGEQLGFFSPIGGEEGGEMATSVVTGDIDKGSNVMVKGPKQRLFLETPRKEIINGDTIQAAPTLSPITSCDVPTSPPASPMVVGMDVKNGVESDRHSNNKVTSTPNTAVMKRQLAASPFASPVLKHPCTTRPEIENDLESGDNQLPLKSDTNETSEMVQPLCLADLQTETYELTSITPTTCTSCFATMGLDDPDFEDTALAIRKQPLHSTAACVMPSPPHPPPVHLTLTDSQSRTHLFVQGFRGEGKINVRSLSHVHPPVSTSLGGGQLTADSGMVSSVDFNGVSGHTNLTSSKLPPGSGDSSSGCITSSTSNPSLIQSAKPPTNDHCVQGGQLQHQDGTDQEANDCNSLTHTYGGHIVVGRDGKHQPVLSTIPEIDFQAMAGKPQPNPVRFHPQCERDSGLFSPEGHNKENSRNDRVMFHSHPPTTTAISSHLHKTPSRYSDTPISNNAPTLFPPSSHVVAPSCTVSTSNHAKFTAKSIAYSNVLPSRIKVSSSNESRTPSNYKLLSRTRPSSFTRTPPSRYSSPLSGSSTSGHDPGFVGFAGEVLRKKETLKARLQFSDSGNQLRSTSPFYESTQFSPISIVGRSRMPLSETSLLNYHGSPLTDYHNKRCSPSPPIHVPKSPWQPPIVFSPIHVPAGLKNRWTTSQHNV